MNFTMMHGSMNIKFMQFNLQYKWNIQKRKNFNFILPQMC